MSDHPPILFYNGNNALAQPVNLQLANGHIFLNEPETGSDIGIFPIAGCRLSTLGDKMFVYLRGGAGPYIVIERSHPDFAALAGALKMPATGWYERLIRQKWPVLAGLLIGILLIIYLLVAQLVPAIGMSLVTADQENALGEKVYASFVYGEKIDSSSTILAQQFAERLRLSSKYRIRITVLNNKDVNAFALPGGHIIVYSGMLKVLDHSEELAGLLGHEVTHVNERHSLRGLMSGISMSILESILLSGFGSMGDLILHNANSLRQLSYSRSLEREADKQGMELMVANQIDPRGMKELMEQLKKANRDLPSAFSFISTHPLTNERIKNADQFIQQHKSGTFAPNLPLKQIWEKLKMLP